MGIQLDDAAALIENLRSLPAETDWAEFKVNTFNPETIGKYVSALANSAMFHDKDHGYLVFGIEDESHNVVGTEVRLDLQKVGNEPFFLWLAKYTEPKIEVQHLRFVIGKKWVELLCIDPGYQRPVNFRHIPYIRVGSAQQPLSNYPHIQQKIWALAARHSFETMTLATNATKDRVLLGFSNRKLFELIGKKLNGDDTILELLESYDLIEKNIQDRYHIKALLPILAGRDLGNFPLLKLKSLRIIQFKGSNKLSALSDREGSRGYAVSFEAAMKYIMDRIPSEEIMLHGVNRRVYKLPEPAIREILANAIIHQDFTADGRPTVEIYSDKIKIINPGTPLIKTDRFINANSKSRNSLFARLMREAHLCEERGRGVDLAVSEIEKASLPPPLFVAAEESTTVTLFMHKPYASWSAEDRIRACYQHACLKHEEGDAMSNASLRARLGLSATQISQVSNLIRDAQDDHVIRPLNEGQANRVARYLPYWA